MRSSFTKRQDMFPVILALCFVLKIFRCSEHYAPKFIKIVFKFGSILSHVSASQVTQPNLHFFIAIRRRMLNRTGGRTSNLLFKSLEYFVESTYNPAGEGALFDKEECR